MNKYDGSGYTGAGYHDRSVDDLVVQPRIKQTEDDNIAQLRSVWQPSPHEFVTDNLAEISRRWTEYDRLLVKSWDLVGNYGVGGSIARFENSHTRSRSEDFEFTIQPRGFHRLKPNMDCLREEVDAGLSRLRWQDVGDIVRYSGATAAGDFQIIVSKIAGEYYFGWVALADQRFIALTNKWRLKESTNTSLDITQSSKKIFDIYGAREYQRNIL